MRWCFDVGASASTYTTRCASIMLHPDRTHFSVRLLAWHDMVFSPAGSAASLSCAGLVEQVGSHGRCQSRSHNSPAGSCLSSCTATEAAADPGEVALPMLVPSCTRALQSICSGSPLPVSLHQCRACALHCSQSRQNAWTAPAQSLADIRTSLQVRKIVCFTRATLLS